MYREYKAEVTLFGFVWVEDSSCPSYWHNSHCYDVQDKFEGEAVVRVWADSLERAKELVYEHEFDFTGDWYMDQVEDVTIENIEVVPGTEDLSDDEGVEIVEYGRCYETELF